MIRFVKEEQIDYCRVMVEKKLHWNWKYQVQDPIYLHIYELNYVNAETGYTITNNKASFLFLVQLATPPKHYEYQL